MMNTPPIEAGPAGPALPRWVQIIAGLALGAFTLLCLAGSVTLVIGQNARAPLLAPITGIVMVLVCCWLLEKCTRLIIGRRIEGGLMGPRALRLVAWLFLLLPVGGIFTSYFVAHPFRAVLQSAAYIAAFFGLRSLARFREQAREAETDPATAANKRMPTPASSVKAVLLQLRDSFGLELLDRPESGKLLIHKPGGLLLRVTVAYDGLEWFIEAFDGSGAIWSDWADYYPVDGEPRDQLSTKMAYDVERCVTILANSEIRVSYDQAESKRRVELRSDGFWKDVSSIWLPPAPRVDPIEPEPKV